jgi:hypothetical protein
MGMQQVEYEFPDEKDETAQEIEVDTPEEEPQVEVEGAVGREEMRKPGDKIKAGDVEIEVEDDTPEQDRGRKPSEPPEAVTDEELENYSEKVKKRIQHFSKGYHDERRAKESAMREREALEQYARKLIEENEQLTGKMSKNQETMLAQAKQQVANELEAAKQKYKQAYESGDSDGVVEAQEAIMAAKIRADKVAAYKPPALQKKEIPVEVPQQPIETQVVRDDRAVTWADDNPWFGSDDEMTAFALGLDSKLKKDGVDPRSDEYYEKINARMRQVFPDQFDDGIEDDPEEAPKPKSSNVVAPATRSTGPKKIRLTQSQIAIAKKLGVPLETYAKQAAELMRKQQ